MNDFLSAPLFISEFGFIGKPFFLLFLFVHLAFSFVVIRQTKIMLRVVEAKISPVIYLIAIIHALYSFFALLISALFL